MQRRVLPLVPRFDPPLWAELFRKGLPFAYAGAMITLVFQVDTVILEKMRGATEVGWYRSPVLVLEGLTMVPRILGYALIPTMAAWAATRPEGVADLYRRGSKYLLLAGLPIGVFGLLESDRFIALLFDAAYAPSVSASRILLPAAVFMFLSNFGETALACVNRWGTIVVVSTMALVVNVALNLVLDPAARLRGSGLGHAGDGGVVLCCDRGGPARLRISRGLGQPHVASSAGGGRVRSGALADASLAAAAGVAGRLRGLRRGDVPPRRVGRARACAAVRHPAGTDVGSGTPRLAPRLRSFPSAALWACIPA